MRRQIEKINYFKIIYSGQTSCESLDLERDHLDRIKEEFNDAHHDFHEFLDTENDREASYRCFDVQDREFMECRLKLIEQIYAVEKASKGSRAKSVASGYSKTSKSSKSTHKTSSTRSSVRARRIEVATRKAQLEVEMNFLDQELQLKKLQLMKDISMANAEEDVMKRILEEDKLINTDCQGNRKPISAVEEIENDNINHQIEKKKLSKMNPNSSPFVPKMEFSDVKPTVDGHNKEKERGLSDSTIRELINLQEKQTELSAIIANHQKISSLPVQEPPICSGNLLDYPAFIQAFEAIIEVK